MPTPKQGEKEKDFVSKCMGSDEMQKYDQDQRVAICYSKFREAKMNPLQVIKSNLNSVQKATNRALYKAEEGQTKMIFGKPYTFSGGKWVQEEPGPDSPPMDYMQKFPDVPEKEIPKLRMGDYKAIMNKPEPKNDTEARALIREIDGTISDNKKYYTPEMVSQLEQIKSNAESKTEPLPQADQVLDLVSSMPEPTSDDEARDKHAQIWNYMQEVEGIPQEDEDALIKITSRLSRNIMIGTYRS